MQPINIIELLQTSAGYLDSCGVAEARAEADILLAYVLETTRDRLYLDRTRQISLAEMEKLDNLLRKRGNRVPLAYILQNREFMGLEFYVDERVLIPRPETELLVEKAMAIGKERKHKLQNLRVLDLCTGSGAVAVSIAHSLKDAAVAAVDISKGALEIAQRNAMKMNVKIDFRQGDLFEPLEGDKFDLIVSNPPYISEEEYTLCMEEVKKEPTLALLAGAEGLDFYQRISEKAEHYLNPQGTILLEIGWMQGKKVSEMFSGKGYKTNVFQDYAGLDRIVIAQKE